MQRRKRGAARKEAKGKIFIAKMQSIGYDVLSPYLGATKHITVRCGKGHEFTRIVSRLNVNSDCPVCCMSRSSESAKQRFLNKMQEKGLTLISDHVDSITKVRVRCGNGHEFDIQPHNVVHARSTACRACHQSCPKQARKKFEKICFDRNILILDDYVNNAHKVTMGCEYGHVFSMKPSHFTSGKGCPQCSGRSATMGYIHLISDDGTPLAIKFGITKSPIRRVGDQNRSSSLHFSVVNVWKFDDTESCKSAEMEIKKTIQCSYLSRTEVPDGWTETTLISNIDIITSIFEKHGGVKIE